MRVNIDREGSEELGSWSGHRGSWVCRSTDRGALNLVAQDVVMRGVRSALLGDVVACSRAARNIEAMSSRCLFKQKITHIHDIVDRSREGAEVHSPAARTQSAGDRLTCRVQGFDDTQVEAFSYIARNQLAFNGHEIDNLMTMNDHRKPVHITPAAGIVTRGKFIDVAR